MKIVVEIPILLGMLLSQAFLDARSPKTEWSEVIYQPDGFALTAPAPPIPYPDTDMPNTTKYSIYLPVSDKHYGLTLRVIHLSHSCKPALQLLKAQITGKTAGMSPFNRGASQIDISSFKELSLGGNPGLQYRWADDTTSTRLDRQYCVNNNIYAFAARWRKANTIPPTISRIMDSFRLVELERAPKH